MPKITVCRSCGASIIWAQTAKGKDIPIDAEPAPDGNIALINGVAHVDSLFLKSAQMHYKSHFATCPNASQHRKPK